MKRYQILYQGARKAGALRMQIEHKQSIHILTTQEAQLDKNLRMQRMLKRIKEDQKAGLI